MARRHHVMAVCISEVSAWDKAGVFGVALLGVGWERFSLRAVVREGVAAVHLQL